MTADHTGGFQNAWVLRCPSCTGGLIYALSTPETRRWRRWMAHRLPCGAEVEYGPIDVLWEIEYCTCTEDTPHA